MTWTLHSAWRAGAPYRVRIGLQLKGAAYDYAPVDLIRGDQRQPGYRAVNAQGLTPALVLDDGTVLAQSLAILEWLEETIPEPAILPRAPLDRAVVRRMAGIIACDIHPLNNTRVAASLRRLGVPDEVVVSDWIHRWIADGFDALVAAVSKDIRARPVLDEWLRLGVARLTDQDEVVLNAAAFVPQEGFEEKLSYLALHVGDHAMAAVENTLGRSDPWFERSVHYRGLSGADVEALRARASELGMKALQTLNGEVKDEVSVADADAVNRRFTFGVYFYADDDERSEETS